MTKLTAEWVRKAEADLRGARELHASTSPLHDLVCFHCQQSGEKYLKALMQEGRLPVPRTHNLLTLLAALVHAHPSLKPVRRGLKLLNRFAVETRYPGDTATKRQAASALAWATRIRAVVRPLLGLRA